jgi:hypothetical protein
VAAVSDPFEKGASLLELLSASALREVAADDDEVRLQIIDAPLDRRDEFLVMCAEVEVRKMNKTSHASSNNREPDPVSRNTVAATENYASRYSRMLNRLRRLRNS